MCSAWGASSAALTESSRTTSAITIAPVIGLRFGLTSDTGNRLASGETVTDCSSDGAAAECDHGVVVFMGGIEYAGDGFRFDAAEVLFPILGEDLGDGEAMLRGDEGVDVEERPAQTRRQDAADRGLTRTHEAGKDNPPGQVGERPRWGR